MPTEDYSLSTNVWWVDSVTIGDSRFFRPVHRPSLLSTHMYRWLPGLKPTTLLDLCTPKTVHKLTPWREVRESDSRLQFCRLAYEPLYELPICIGPGGGTQTLVAGATILHFNPLNYSWDIFGEGLRCRSPCHPWHQRFSRPRSRPLELTLRIGRRRWTRTS